jgi:hypothetical protein
MEVARIQEMLDHNLRENHLKELDEQIHLIAERIKPYFFILYTEHSTSLNRIRTLK